MQNITDAQLHERARKRVEFKAHLVVYLVINGALWFTWWITGQGYIWPVWPLVGWGIGLLFHYIFEYRGSGIFSEEEEYKRLKKELEKEN